MENKIKGLVFDLDGVITDTAKFHYIAWRDTVAKIGIALTEDVNESIKGLNRKDTLKAILDIYKVNLEETVIDQLCEEKNNYYLRLLETNLTENDLLAGIKELLIAAKQKGLKLSIASSSLNAKLILEKLKVIDMFDYIVNPKNVKNPKPFPDIYLDATYGIGLNPDQVVGFEDAIIGINGLNDAHIFSVGINANDINVKNKSSLHYSTTKELDLEQILAIANQGKNMKILFVSDIKNVVYKNKLIDLLVKTYPNNDYQFIDVNKGIESNIVDDSINAIQYAKSLNEPFKMIIIDNFGSASFMVASKFKNIIVAQLEDEHSAKMTRDHNNTNVICIGSYNVSIGLGYNIAKKFIDSNYSGGRHQVRIDMLDKLLSKED